MLSHSWLCTKHSRSSICQDIWRFTKWLYVLLSLAAPPPPFWSVAWSQDYLPANQDFHHQDFQKPRFPPQFPLWAVAGFPSSSCSLEIQQLLTSTVGAVLQHQCLPTLLPIFWWNTVELTDRYSFLDTAEEKFSKTGCQQGWASPCQSTWQSWSSHHHIGSCHKKPWATCKSFPNMHIYAVHSIYTKKMLNKKKNMHTYTRTSQESKHSTSAECLT